MTKVVHAVDTVLKWFLASLMAAIVLVVSWQVISRFVLNAPSSITEELSRTLLIWIGMVGAAFAYRTGQHLGLDILTRKLPLAWQQRLAPPVLRRGRGRAWLDEYTRHRRRPPLSRQVVGAGPDHRLRAFLHPSGRRFPRGVEVRQARRADLPRGARNQPRLRRYPRLRQVRQLG